MEVLRIGSHPPKKIEIDLSTMEKEDPINQPTTAETVDAVLKKFGWSDIVISISKWFALQPPDTLIAFKVIYFIFFFF